MNLLKTIEHLPRAATMAGCIGFLALIGIVDYLTGFEVFFSVFYLLAVSAGTWFVSRGFGLAISCLSASAWIAGDVAAGAHYSSSFIPVWNTAILLAFYFIVVWLLASLRALHRNLEIRVQERTQALTIEMGERERLEKEILEISEREQRRIGRDLHDSICQHLTATALAGQVLEEKLSARSIPEAADASKIVQLVEEGINLSRSLAHGILPVDLDSEGLVSAMQELCGGITRTGKVECIFSGDPTALIRDPTAATHLYRITQEAISNAIRHGKARRIDVTLAEHGGCVTLTIEDDGVGLPDPSQKSTGLGTRIMAHRAGMVSGTFSIEPNPTGGTCVRCSLPIPPPSTP